MNLPSLTEAPLGPPIPRGPAGAAYDIVFLDRDGTINVRRPGTYLRRPAELELLPGAARAISRMNRAGIRVVVVTNQRGIALGVMSQADVTRVHARLGSLLTVEDGWLDAIEVCPHEVGTCSCRKPLTGLFERGLARASWARAQRCAMVGDMPSDIIPAVALGMRAVLLGADASDLESAVDLLLSPVG